MKSGCESCKFRLFAEKRPNTWIYRLWKWHTTWCPGWKSYQERLNQAELDQAELNQAELNQAEKKTETD